MVFVRTHYILMECVHTTSESGIVHLPWKIQVLYTYPDYTHSL